MNNNDFKALKKLWYAKLKASGFRDIEYEDGSIESPVPRLLRSRMFQKESIEIIEDYYVMCVCFLDNYNFETQRHKAIWEYYTEGLSVRQISAILCKAKLKGCSRSNVGHIIKKYTTIMKKMYLST